MADEVKEEKQKHILPYDKKQSFWADAPTMSFITATINSLPHAYFLQNISPKPLIGDNNLSPYYSDQSDEVYIYSEKSEKYSNEYFTFKKLNYLRTLEYADFISQHFYEDNLKIKKTYPAGFLNHALKEGKYYGIEARVYSTNKLVGILITKHLGQTNYGFSASLVQELCIHSDYRKKGLPNLMLRRLYAYSMSSYKTKVHFFQIDYFGRQPCVLLSGSNILIRKKEKGRLIFNEKIPLNPIIIAKMKQYFLENSIYAIEKPGDDIVVYKSYAATIVLRDLFEYKDSNKEPSAELIWAEGEKAAVDALLDSLEYSHYECRTFRFSTGWTSTGSTYTYAFGLDYGRPAERAFYYL